MSTTLAILGMVACMGCLVICIGIGGKLVARWRSRHPRPGSPDQDD